MDLAPLVAYFSPETVLPVTSVVATVFGVVLMFGRNAIRLAIRLVRLAVAVVRGGRGGSGKGPHISVAKRRGTGGRPASGTVGRGAARRPPAGQG